MYLVSISFARIHIIGYTILALVSLIYLFLVLPHKNRYFTSIAQFRNEKNYFFNNSEDSPVENKDSLIQQLNYFPIDPALKVEAGVVIFEKKDTVMMDLLGDPNQNKSPFIRYGSLKFSYSDEIHELMFYKSLSEQDSTHFFVPFYDFTNDILTYGRGRYLDFYWARDKVIQMLDFNLAYNPFCAYNHKYICPVPPEENMLQFSVEAGEMSF